MPKRRFSRPPHRFRLLRAFFAGVLICASYDAAAGLPQAAAPADATVRELFASLNAKSFARRREAHAKLRNLPADRIELLAGLIDNTPHREAAVRATQLLEDGYRSDDAPARRAASVALERLAYEGADDVRQIAASILDRNNSTRHALALELLKELGAGIKLPPARRPDNPINPGQRPLFANPNQLPDNQVRIHFSKAWRGSADDLRIVERLKSSIYQSLAIYVINDSTIDGDQLARLQEVFDARVQQRGPVLLGIVAETNLFGPPIDGCLVRSVEEGSSADFGGILPGDRIIGVNSDEIRDFAELVGHLKAHNEGDIVNVVVLRPSIPESPDDIRRRLNTNPARLQKVELSVKLTSWDESIRDISDETPDADAPVPVADDPEPEAPKAP